MAFAGGFATDFFWGGHLECLLSAAKIAYNSNPALIISESNSSCEDSALL